MKIMMVNGLHLGGVRAVIENIVSILGERNEISLFAGLDQYGKPLWAVEDRREGSMHIRGINIGKFRNTRRVSNYFNPHVEEPFREFLFQVKPDVVHFHSCMCIGYSVIQVVKELEIPFLVTMHDWWWFCPRLYLVDNRYEVCTQSAMVHPEKCYCVRRGNFEERRYRLLQEVVKGIPLILVPSEYIRNSLVRNSVHPDKIRINSNGIRVPDEIVEKTPSEHIRFAFLGGSDGFKGGVILLRAAQRLRNGYCLLKMYNYRRAGLISDTAGHRDFRTSISHGIRRSLAEPFDKWLQLRSFIKNRKTFKSTSHVTIELLPSFELGDLDEMFKEIDVVIVPSVMRESFNLVAREALSRNTPVICSDSGGPEEVIRDGVNGYIFRTNDDEQLARIMESLVQDPSRVDILRGNIDRRSIIDVESQALQLEEVYEELSQ